MPYLMLRARHPLCHRPAAGAIADGVDHAHYSLHAEGNMLEGSYYEDVGGERRNEMVVKVTFDAGASGQFQLAKVRHVFANEDGTTPEPQVQEEPKTVFEFDFNAQSDSRFHLSTSRWLSRHQEATVQFLTVDDDAFVFTKVHTRARAQCPFPARAASNRLPIGCLPRVVSP